MPTPERTAQLSSNKAMKIEFNRILGTQELGFIVPREEKVRDPRHYTVAGEDIKAEEIRTHCRI